METFLHGIPKLKLLLTALLLNFIGTSYPERIDMSKFWNFMFLTFRIAKLFPNV